MAGEWRAVRRTTRCECGRRTLLGFDRLRVLARFGLRGLACSRFWLLFGLLSGRGSLLWLGLGWLLSFLWSLCCCLFVLSRSCVGGFLCLFFRLCNIISGLLLRLVFLCGLFFGRIFRRLLLFSSSTLCSRRLSLHRFSLAIGGRLLSFLGCLSGGLLGRFLLGLCDGLSLRFGLRLSGRSTFLSGCLLRSSGRVRSLACGVR